MKLTWDAVGSRFYDTGLDHGVLYLRATEDSDWIGIAWNGLTEVSEAFPDDKTEGFYIDGQKVRDIQGVGSFVGTIQAFTYPDEFEKCEGILNLDSVLYDGQPPEEFCLVYRTKMGNDLLREDYSSKIHVLYNLRAIPSTRTYSTLGNETLPVNFSWDVIGVNVEVPGFRPTNHAVFSLNELDSRCIYDLEQMLYGTETINPTLPRLDVLVKWAQDWAPLWIIDNGDGTWTAKDHGEFITILDSTTFQISSDAAVYSDGTTYSLSSNWS